MCYDSMMKLSKIKKCWSGPPEQGIGGRLPPPHPPPQKKVLCGYAPFFEVLFKCALFEISNQTCI